MALELCLSVQMVPARMGASLLGPEGQQQVLSECRWIRGYPMNVSVMDQVQSVVPSEARSRAANMFSRALDSIVQCSNVGRIGAD